MFKKLKGKLRGDGQSSGMSLGTDQHQQYAGNAYQGIQEQGQSSSSSSKKPQQPQGEYTAPPGPPPSHSQQYPQQPPPSWSPPPYHDWTVIPDTALLPPPPSLGYESSPTYNASFADSERGLEFTRANPLWPPQPLHPSTLSTIHDGKIALLKPPTYTGDLTPLRSPGHWKARTHSSCKDSCLLSNLPIYSALHTSPLITRTPVTIYFEVKCLSLSRGSFTTSGEVEAGLALGFAAPPYPTFRLPGWERASLAVHSDDGRRYVNDTYGGMDFTTPFQKGDVVGIGMTLSLPRDPPEYNSSTNPTTGGDRDGNKLDIEVFFTRNGVVEGKWDGNEELDAERSEGGNEGLRGERDLFAAVGVFGGVDFEVMLGREGWVYNLP